QPNRRKSELIGGRRLRNEEAKQKEETFRFHPFPSWVGTCLPGCDPPGLSSLKTDKAANSLQPAAVARGTRE
ncbi:unnamed protein product, partial [Chrysoparadoxa australica]